MAKFKFSELPKWGKILIWSIGVVLAIVLFVFCMFQFHWFGVSTPGNVWGSVKNTFLEIIAPFSFKNAHLTWWALLIIGGAVLYWATTSIDSNDHLSWRVGFFSVSIIVVLLGILSIFKQPDVEMTAQEKKEETKKPTDKKGNEAAASDKPDDKATQPGISEDSSMRLSIANRTQEVAEKAKKRYTDSVAMLDSVKQCGSAKALAELQNQSSWYDNTPLVVKANCEDVVKEILQKNSTPPSKHKRRNKGEFSKNIAVNDGKLKVKNPF